MANSRAPWQRDTPGEAPSQGTSWRLNGSSFGPSGAGQESLHAHADALPFDQIARQPADGGGPLHSLLHVLREGGDPLHAGHGFTASQEGGQSNDPVSRLVREAEKGRVGQAD